MGRRSLNKSADSLTQGGCVRTGSEAVFPPEIVQGIYRYTKLAGAVYSVYRETTKKYIGLALYNDGVFEGCPINYLIKALESKDRK